MGTTIVRLSAEPTQTRVLMTQGPRDIGRVILPRAPSVHPRAAATLLEGLSLFLGERLSVVLCVDEGSTSCELALLDGLGFGERSIFYEVGIAARMSRANHRAARALRLPGSDFRDCYRASRLRESEPFSIRLDEGRRRWPLGVPLTEPDWARLSDSS